MKHFIQGEEEGAERELQAHVAGTQDTPVDIFAEQPMVGGMAEIDEVVMWFCSAVGCVGFLRPVMVEEAAHSAVEGLKQQSRRRLTVPWRA